MKYVKHKYLLIFGLATIVLGALFSFGTAGKLSAAGCPGPAYCRDYNYGYFAGDYTPWIGYVFLPMDLHATLPAYAKLYGLGTPDIGNCDLNQCRVTEASFIAVYKARLNDTNQVDAGRAAAEIDVMMGMKGTDFPTIASGIKWAQENFDNPATVTSDNQDGIPWTQLIDIYANKEVPGYSVNWNYTATFTSTIDGMGVRASRAADSPPECTAQDECDGNITFVDDTVPGSDETVRFYNGSPTKFFDIKHKCANFTGDQGSLIIPKATLKLKPTVTATINGKPGTIANVGDKVQFTYSVGNPNTTTSTSTTCTIYRNTLSGYHDDPPPYDTTPATGNSTGTGCPRTFPASSTTTILTDAPVTATTNTTLCSTLVVNSDPSPQNPADNQYAEACVPVLATTCSSGQPTPEPDPKTKFTIPINISFSPDNVTTEAMLKSDTAYVKFTGPGSFSFSQSGIATTVNPGVVVATSSSIGPTDSTGSATGNFGLDDSSGNPVVTCPINFTVADMPYFNVQAGDVESGDCMETGSSSETSGDDDGSVVGWSQEKPGYAGAGTQYAAFALGYLQDFVTGQNNTGAVPDGLSFSNTANLSETGSGSDTYGGAFGSESPCVPDYYGTPSNPEPSGYTVNSGLPLSVNPGIGSASHQIIYVNGNVFINSNITYNQSTPYGSVSDIPSFTVIAKGGNIYIGPNVTRLDGLYVAEPSGNAHALTGGTIYTCTTVPDNDIQNGDTNLNVNGDTLSHGYYNACNQQLTVTGSFVANQVELLRTAGTLHDSSSTPAELFNYNPEVWLTTPPIGGGSGTTGDDGYDAIADLPPSL